MDRAEHWCGVYAKKGERDVSWFESEPAASLRLLETAGLSSGSCVIDVGAGTSHLVDALVARGLTCVTVLDVSTAALARVRERLGPAGAVPRWIVADALGSWSIDPVDIWHDRALFHFLTDPEDRTRYMSHVRESLKVGGSLILATFALDGPERCSGLPVARYSPETLGVELGPAFRRLESLRHRHVTPSGAEQVFQYSRFARLV